MDGWGSSLWLGVLSKGRAQVGLRGILKIIGWWFWASEKGRYKWTSISEEAWQGGAAMWVWEGRENDTGAWGWVHGSGCSHNNTIIIVSVLTYHVNKLKLNHRSSSLSSFYRFYSFFIRTPWGQHFQMNFQFHYIILRAISQSLKEKYCKSRHREWWLPGATGRGEWKIIQWV